eukprot:gnl/MRDRNA2_/MRDRNA2_166744_c0_seq1.p1 gnl/MRDRNA2_/MRDRNA2_166744_c0~~gnl/MRDRNA2_/MRDRNA2_166744_c0_seq1.p1  ORF type:complete len:639 (+),score=131.63 gnl/MRDRNA2_/MRDRNA2_166744_c0_seq1:65-1981(+)
MSSAYRCGTFCSTPPDKSRAGLDAPKIFQQVPVYEPVHAIAEAHKSEMQVWLGKVTEQQRKLQAEIEQLINRRNDAVDKKLDGIREIVLGAAASSNGVSGTANTNGVSTCNAASVWQSLKGETPAGKVGGAAGLESVILESGKLEGAQGSEPSPSTKKSLNSVNLASAKQKLKNAAEKVKQMNKFNNMIKIPRHVNVNLDDPEVVMETDDDKMLVDDLMKQMGLMTEKEEETGGSPLARFRRFLKSTSFDLAVGFVIMINSVVMALNLEYEGHKNATLLDQVPDTDWWPAADEAFGTIEHIFSALFVGELFLRLYALGLSYFASKANWLDCAIVLTTVLDLYVFSATGITFPNVSVIRLLRIVKLVRVLRIIRVLRFFRQLRILIHSIISSVGALGWSMALLSIIQLIGAIIMAQTLQPWLRDEKNDLELRLHVYEYFGTFSRAVITMFEITFAPGAWGGIGRIIMYKVNRNYTVFFLLYVSGVTFAVIRVITAIFLKETLAAAESDREMKMAEKKRQRDAYIRSLQTLFSELDTDGGGNLNLEEVKKMMNDPRVEIWMSVLDLEVHEVEDLFALIDTGDGEISFDEFMAGLLRLKGSAKAIDVVTLLYNGKRNEEKLAGLQDEFKELQRLIRTKLPK